MSKIDWFGHWFYFFLFIGMLLLQAKDYRGWAFRFAGEIGWIGIGFYLGMSSIWLWGFAFMAVDVLGYFKWQKEQEELAWVENSEEYLGETFPEEDPGLEYIKRLQADHDRIEKEQFEYWATKFGALKEETKKVKANGKNKNKQRQGQRTRVAKANRKTTNRKIRPARRRSSK